MILDLFITVFHDLIYMNHPVHAVNTPTFAGIACVMQPMERCNLQVAMHNPKATELCPYSTGFGGNCWSSLYCLMHVYRI